MIESIYNGESKESRDKGSNVMMRMPKNIRQIGQPDATPKIYMEDYVMTYVRQLAMRDYSNYKIAVLLGQFMKSNGVKNIFISGAIEAYDINVENESTFSNETWTNIYEDVKTYFDDVEIVGWYIAKPGLMLETTDMITRLHVNNFAGQDKTLLMYDSIEKEEVFYVYDNGRLNKQQGYYIYYEKNEEMQNYMVENKKIPSEEENYDDRAIKEIRQVIESKKDMKIVKEKGGTVSLLYGASTMLAAVVLVIGATMLNNYDKMKSMEKTLNVISDHIIGSEKKEDVKINNKVEEAVKEESTEEVIEVKKISGKIEKLEDEKNSAKKFENQEKPVTNTTQKKVRYYTIKEGDTLATISAKYYKSIYHVDEILKANGIEDKNKIVVGQKIIIP